MNPLTDLDPLHPVAAAVDRARALYRADVRWTAPRRGLCIVGRDALVAHLLAEARAMREPDLQPIRRAASGAARWLEESVIRFVYAGDGIVGLAAFAGDRVELGRVRVLDFEGEQIVAETCVETWSVLAPRAKATAGRPDGSTPAPGDGSSPHPDMALPERFARPG